MVDNLIKDRSLGRAPTRVLAATNPNEATTLNSQAL